jgi:hypothetical protein
MPCFSSLDSRNLNGLILIFFSLARATRAGALRREASATLAAGPPGIANPHRRVPVLAAQPPMWSGVAANDALAISAQVEL